MDRAVRKPEVLAPVGSWQCFWAAIENGADSIYVGLKGLNARDLAPNFDINEMASLVEVSHKHNVKVYVTLNSLIKENEIEEVVKYLCALKHIRPDALIIQDIGLLYLCKRFFPKFELHASTLMGFHNSAGVITARNLGFKRVVLARELTLEEIRACCRVEDIEIEIFVAGALCFSISGLCLMSSFLGGKSGMRGRCVQPCRRRYNIKDKFGYFFSMKDLCLIDFVPELIDIGVKAFKIEGRLRPAHYVASMVKAFRLAIDDPLRLDEAKRIAENACGRPHTTAYIKNPHPDDAIDPYIAPNTGLYVGKVLDVLGEKLLLENKIDVSTGDKLRFVDKKQDIQKSFSVINVELNERRAGILLSLDNKDKSKLNKFFRKGILVFKTSSLYKVNKKNISLKSKISLSNISKEKKIILEKLRGQQNKKRVKRDLIKKNIIKIRTISQLSIIKIKYDLIFFELKGEIQDTVKAFNYFKRKNILRDTVWFLPVFIPEEESKKFKSSLEWLFKKGCRNFGISSLGQLSFLNAISNKITIYGSYQLNIANSLSIKALKFLGIKNLEFSIESDFRNLESALKNSPSSVRIYQNVFGLIPLFSSRMRHLTKIKYYPIISPKKEKFFLLKDKFLEYIVPELPINILKETKNIHRIDGFIFDFRFQTNVLKPILKSRKELKRITKCNKFNWNREWY